MSDPLSIAAGVSGFVSLGLQVSEALIDFYVAYKHLDADVEKTLQNLESLRNNFKLLLRALEERLSLTEENDVLVDVGSSIERCIDIVQELNDECKKLRSIPDSDFASKVKIASRRLAYPFRRSTLLKLQEDIKEIRGNIDSALLTLQLKDLRVIQDDINSIKTLTEVVRAGQISSEIRSWLKAPDASIVHNAMCAKRHLDSGSWFVEGSLFNNWLEKESSFLWLNGFAGCGKSVLCSTAIQHVFSQQQHELRTGIAFFYFTFDDTSRQDVYGLLKALLLQLSGQISDGHTALRDLHASYLDSTPPFQILLESLKGLVQRFEEVRFFIDALDEIPTTEKRQDVLKSLTIMSDWQLPGLHVLVTSRDEADIRRSLTRPNKANTSAKVSEVSMANDGIDQDIANYISGQLRSDPDMQAWHQFHDKIQRELTVKAGGMFQWVECQFEILRKCPRSEYRLERCLASLPQTLDRTYELMLYNIDSDSMEDTRRILTLLCFSLRPLTVSELIDGVAVDLAGVGSLDHSRRLQGADDLRTLCPGLLAFAQKEQNIPVSPDPDEVLNHFAATTVHLAHFSIQEYLESERIKQQKASFYALSRTPSILEILQVCLVYLLEPGLKTSIGETTFREFPLAWYAASCWYSYYQDLNGADKQADARVMKLFRDTPGSFRSWLSLHNPEQPWIKARSALPGKHQTASPLYYASLLGFERIVDELLAAEFDQGEKQALIDKLGGECGNALQAAALHGHTRVVKKLLDHGGSIALRSGLYDTALQAACVGGHDAIIEILLGKGSDVNAQGGVYNSSLYAACLCGHSTAVELLLSNRASPNVPGGFYGFPLQAASARGHESVVQLLLDHKAGVDAEGGKFGTALVAAASVGHTNTVRLLLRYHADVNGAGAHYGSALQAASARGHKDIVQMLLNSNADVNKCNGFYGTALQAASAEGHLQLVELLLENGANVLVHGGKFGDALQAALRNGHGTIEQLLQRMMAAQAPQMHGAVNKTQQGRRNTWGETAPPQPQSRDKLRSPQFSSSQNPHYATAEDIQQIILEGKEWPQKEKSYTGTQATKLSSDVEEMGLITELSTRRHIFLVDDAASMKRHWQQVRTVIHALTYLIKRSTNASMELRFMQRDQKFSSKNSAGFLKALDEARLQGESDINVRIRDIFFAPSKKKFFSTSGVKSHWEPARIYILTDGAWTAKVDASTSIIALSSALIAQNHRRNHITLVFIHFGDDQDAAGGLERLQLGYGRSMDIVEYEPATGNVFTMLLGRRDLFDPFDQQHDRECIVA